mmetsp:Transcript_24068/g.71447  ORF Transcript_24068/g.71447 Transcript_24068/m.71447 type:complete len:273 (+) Transcript_24068:891-1709(+)
MGSPKASTPHSHPTQTSTAPMPRSPHRQTPRRSMTQRRRCPRCHRHPARSSGTTLVSTAMLAPATPAAAVAVRPAGVRPAAGQSRVPRRWLNSASTTAAAVTATSAALARQGRLPASADATVRPACCIRRRGRPHPQWATARRSAKGLPAEVPRPAWVLPASRDAARQPSSCHGAAYTLGSDQRRSAVTGVADAGRRGLTRRPRLCCCPYWPAPDFVQARQARPVFGISLCSCTSLTAHCPGLLWRQRIPKPHASLCSNAGRCVSGVCRVGG